MQIKGLDILLKKIYSCLNSQTIQSSGQLSTYPNLLELAMKASYSKSLKVKLPRDFGSLLEVFSFWGVIS
jgi:hypothetical protein